MTDVQDVQKRTVTMPNGVYRVSFSQLNGCQLIERENPATMKWRVVWSASMLKPIGKRLSTIVVLATA